jgi:enoyl-CoA hydratase/carnithine racemase
MEVRDGVVTLLLDRAQQGNALGPEMVEALEAGIDAAQARGARMIVLRGQGRNFCTGLDLSGLDSLSDGDLALHLIRIEMLLQKVHSLPITTLAVAQGRVFGAGADLFAVCDHRIALHGSSFAFPGPAFGLVLGTRRLANLVGDTTARRLLLAGGVTDATMAREIGLASEVIAPEEVEAMVTSAAAAAARLDPTTVAALHARTRTADDAGDLAALARSVAAPGLKQRIESYRAKVMAEREKK